MHHPVVILVSLSPSLLLMSSSLPPWSVDSQAALTLIHALVYRVITVFKNPERDGPKENKEREKVSVCAEKKVLWGQTKVWIRGPQKRNPGHAESTLDA